MDCSSPGSSVHEISQARILGWVAISFSRGSSRPRGSSQPRKRTCISCIGRWLLYHWATWDAQSSTIVSEVSQSCQTLCDPVDCSPPGSSIHGILQARILEWVAISSSRGSSRPRDWTWVSFIAGRFFTIWATREAQFLFKSAALKHDWKLFV